MMSRHAVPLLICLFVLLGCASTGTPVPEVTYDGLRLQENTAFNRVWAAPDIDLSSYTALLPRKAQIQFRATRGRGSAQNGYPVSEQQREALVELIGEIFRDEINKNQRFAVTDTPGPETLLLEVSLIDIVSMVPPDVRGRGNIYLTRIGEVTLVLELRDSQNGEVLVRAAERGAAEPPGMGTRRSSSVTSRSEVQRLARRWGNKIRTGLDSL